MLGNLIWLLLLMQRGVKLTRGAFERIHSAVTFFMPQTRRQRSYTTAVLAQWRKVCPPRHAAAMPWSVAVALACFLAVHNYPRVGGMLLLQWILGLRPGEILHRFGASLFPTTGTPADDVCVITLGIKHGTKSGRAQTACIKACDRTIARVLVGAFKCSGSPNCRLSHVASVGQYGRLMQWAAREYDLAWLNLSAHSPRPGWATYHRLRGMPFEELKEKGRWQSDKTVCTYLDQAAASSQTVHLGRLAGVTRWYVEKFY